MGSTSFERRAERGNSQASAGATSEAGGSATPAGGSGVEERGSAGVGGGLDGDEDGTDAVESGAGGGGGDPMLSSGGGGGEDGEVVPSTKGPDDFGGLVLWLKFTEDDCLADQAGRLARCFDRSGKLNDAIPVIPEDQPTLIARALNGHHVASFQRHLVEEGADRPDALMVADSESLQLGTQDFLYAFVGNWTNPTAVGYLDYGYGTVLAKHNDYAPYEGVVLLANYPSITPGMPSFPRFAFQATTTGALVLSRDLNLNDGTFRLYLARRVGVELEMRINGQVQGQVRTTSVLDVSMPGHSVLVGGKPGSPLMGELAEVLIIRDKISDDDVAALERGLMRKFAL